MAIEKFRKIQLDDKKTKAFQDNVESKLNGYDSLVFFNGNLLKDIDIAITDTKINHGLGRTPSGYLIISKNANSNIWNTSTFNTKDITLKASVAVTASLWVF